MTTTTSSALKMMLTGLSYDQKLMSIVTRQWSFIVQGLPSSWYLPETYRLSFWNVLGCVTVFVVIFNLCSHVEVLCVFICIIHRGYLYFIKLQGVRHNQFVGLYMFLFALSQFFSTLHEWGGHIFLFNDRWSPGHLGLVNFHQLPSNTFITGPVLPAQFGLVSVNTDSNSYTHLCGTRVRFFIGTKKTS
jgi:hypothetical protein